jgi:glycosyltransferase involved in cell wall biosynthesis
MTKEDYEIIIVDDGSDESIFDLCMTDKRINVVEISKERKWWKNPCIPFNMGFNYIKGDKVIIQNAECVHFNDIMLYVEKNLKKDIYLSFACLSLDKENSSNFLDGKYISPVIENLKTGGNCWYNHSTIRPTGYHFCCAMMIEDLKRIGGFNENFAEGFSFDDDEFIYRIRRDIKNFKIVDNPFVCHLWHYTGDSFTSKVQNDKNCAQLVDRNRILFDELKKKQYYKVENKIFIGE